MTKRKTISRLFSLVLAVVMAVSGAVVSMATSTTYNSKTYTNGTYVTFSESSKTKYFYKLTVKDNTYIKVDCDTNYSNTLSAEFIVTKKFPTNGEIYPDNSVIDCKFHTGLGRRIALKPGTYYFFVRMPNPTDKVRIRLTEKGIAFGKYSKMSTAMNLKASYSVVSVQRTDKTANKWCKINLTKKKAITFYTSQAAIPGEYGNITIYNSKGKVIDYTDASNLSIMGSQAFKFYKYKTAKLAAGIYYVKLGFSKNSMIGNPYFSAVTDFMWK